MKKDKITIARKNDAYTNCIGTAFFLTGIEKKDKFIDPEDFQNYVGKKLVPISHPISGGLISFEKEGIPVHMGVITSKKPLLITHRTGGYHPSFEDNSPILENEKIKQLKDTYNTNHQLKEVFYKIKK